MKLTLVQAQERFIKRYVKCHAGHRNRVKRSAWKQLADWARRNGYDPLPVCRDAYDVAMLELQGE